jgi:hypothetical protein
MTPSYRYLNPAIALREANDVRAGIFDIASGLEKNDFHQRTFSQSLIEPARLLEIRDAMFSLFNQKASALPGLAPQNFDSEFTKNINNVFFDLSVIDGFSTDVWSYINLRVLPDFVLWRWPDNHVERFLGGSERSCFHRLWQRAFVLGPDLASQLQEDEAVNIFERPEALGGNRRLAKAMAEYIVNNRSTTDVDTGYRIVSTEIVKKSAKRMRRAMSIQLAQTMTTSELEQWIKDQFAETLRGLTVESSDSLEN